MGRVVANPGWPVWRGISVVIPFIAVTGSDLMVRAEVVIDLNVDLFSVDIGGCVAGLGREGVVAAVSAAASTGIDRH